MLAGLWSMTLSAQDTVSCEGTERTDIRPTSPTERWVIPVGNEQLAVDRLTGLAWARCQLGYVLSGSACVLDASPTVYTWADALVAAGTTGARIEADYATGWRLPNIKELSGITEQRCFGPAFNADIFPNVSINMRLLSSTPVPKVDSGTTETRILTVHTSTSGIYTQARAETHMVRLVRELSTDEITALAP